MHHTPAIQTFYPIFRTLSTHQVRYVLTGSVASLLYGVTDIQPGDLDIVPSCTPDNLARLTAALTDLQATTGPSGGEWSTDERGEWKWIARDLSQEEQESWRWEPKYDDCRTFDRVFETPHGRLDIVPQIANPYTELIQRAELMHIAGIEIRVASLEDVLATLTVPRREKDVARVRQLRALQFRRANERNSERR